MKTASKCLGLLILAGFASAWLVRGFASAATALPFDVTARQELVIVKTTHLVWAQPDQTGPQVAAIHAQRPLTGGNTVLPVLEHRAGWLNVRLPGRQLGSAAPPATGWIVASGITYFGTPWHIVVDTARRRALIFNSGRVVRTFPVIVGRPSTPTPRGEYFVEEAVALRPGEPGGPFALATSARSSVFQEFDGGPGQIALHGRDRLGGVLGTAVSHGCVRFSRDAITWLAESVGTGTPVTVR